MVINTATHNDADALARIGRALHDESPVWRRFAYREEKVAAFLRTLIEMGPRALVLAAKAGDEVVGGIAAVAAPHWSFDELRAEEASFFVLPQHRGGTVAARLIKRMTAWARDLGCVRLTAGTGTGVNSDRVIGLYGALGFEPCGTQVQHVF